MALGIVNTISAPQTFGIHVDDVSNAKIVCSGTNVRLSWTDPDDVYSKGAMLARWAGTLIIRKEGSEPKNRTDGLILYKSTVKNQYSTITYTDVPPKSNVTYYYKLFTYTTGNVYSPGVTIQGRLASTVVTVPTFNGTYEFNYDEDSHSVTINTDTNHTVDISGVQTATEAGTYTITCSLTNNSHLWSDGTVAPKLLEWKINPVNATLTLNKSIVYMQGDPEWLDYTYVGDGKLEITNERPDLVNVSIISNRLYFLRKSAETGIFSVTLTAKSSNNYIGKSVNFMVINYRYKKMTVQIDMSQSDPELACTYANDAVNMTPGSSDWDTFFGHYPVLFKDGQEVVKIDPTDFTKDIRGNTIDITSGDAGDVMIAFPRRGISISTTGDVVTVTMSEHPEDSNFNYYAHSRGNVQKDIFYMGAYEASNINNKLYSLSGKTPAVSTTLENFRTYARAKGASDGNGSSGYDAWAWFQLVYIQVMYLLKYKNLNSQAKIGYGLTATSLQTTGKINTSGMDYGTTANSTTAMKLFGLENLWGNCDMMLEGYITISNKMYVSNDNYNNSATGYIDTGFSQTSSISNYIKTVHGNNLLAFTIKTTGGSSTTYFCDASANNSGTVITRYGGYYGESSNVYCGIFRQRMEFGLTGTGPGTTVRLMYV